LRVGSGGCLPPPARRCYARQPRTAGERLGGRERLTWASLSRYPPAVNRSDLVKVSDIPGISDYRECLGTMPFGLAAQVK
jgi:hypothetical protein